MDEIPSAPQRPPSAAKLSRTPSWVMLGFLLGAGFVWLLLRPSPDLSPTAPAPAKASAGQGVAQKVVQQAAPVAPAAPAKPKPRQLSTVEAVFEAYGKNAIWERDRTEVALWNSDKGAYSDFYEVYREEGTYFFRSIPVLTRPLMAVSDQVDVPLVFTETAALRRERIEALRHLVPAHAVPSETLPKPDVEAPKP